jgi:hypothetical protein
MQAPTRTEALLEAIERRIAEISERQHALAVERARLTEQITPLRLGITAPDVALTLLRAKGIVFRGIAAATSDDRPPRSVVLRVAHRPVKLTAVPKTRSETA